MPKIDLSSVPIKTGSSYPGARAALMDGRSQQAVAVAGGLTQFGANLVRLEPGAMSALRHWHEQQDELAIVTEGRLTLIEDDGETPLSPGDCVTFKAGVGNGHHIVNRSDAPAAFLVIGTHTETERGHYSDEDMIVDIDADGYRFTKKDGTPVT